MHANGKLQEAVKTDDWLLEYSARQPFAAPTTIKLQLLTSSTWVPRRLLCTTVTCSFIFWVIIKCIKAYQARRTCIRWPTFSPCGKQPSTKATPYRAAISSGSSNELGVGRIGLRLDTWWMPRISYTGIETWDLHRSPIDENGWRKKSFRGSAAAMVSPQFVVCVSMTKHVLCLAKPQH